MRLTLLKQILSVPSPSGNEDAMIEFIRDHVQRRGEARCGQLVVDQFNNVLIRKGKPGTVPFLAAHLDTVHDSRKVTVIQKNGRLSGIDEHGNPKGIGGDDKAGVFICLELLERFADIAVVLFASEELGCVGAKNAPDDWFKDAGCLIEFDCPGKGLVSYTSGGERLFANDGEFIKACAPAMRVHGLTRWQHHPFSDVRAIRHRFNMSCLNLSSGYYNWHQSDEFVVIEEVEAAIAAGDDLVGALGSRNYPYSPKALDTAETLYPVTSLHVGTPTKFQRKEPIMKSQPEVKVDTIEAQAVTGIRLDESANLEPLDEPQDRESLWDRFMPNDVPFFKMGLMDRLVRRSYHTASLEGELKVKDLMADHGNRVYRSEVNVGRTGVAKPYRLLLRLGEDTFGYIDGRSFKVYAPSPEAAVTVAKEFIKYLKPESSSKPFYYIISMEHGNANAEKVYVERTPPATSKELALHYGDDFPAWESLWIKRLGQKQSGLTILHGPPGGGKTYFLRAMAARLLDRAAIYIVPLSEVELLSNPRFVSFWVEQAQAQGKKMKIVILEDAEELLLPRDCGSRDKVSNLLNIADGFLGDHLKIQVIATTNAKIRQLDPAVLRPGRLVGEREFRRLTRAEAERLAKAKGLALPHQADYSLAEIYNEAGAATEFSADRRVGFAV